MSEDLTQHDLEKHTEGRTPLPKTLQWYKNFTASGAPKCPTCGAPAVVTGESEKA